MLCGVRTRLRIDIRHLYLPGLEMLRGRAITAVGKHVCGAATDLMLRSVVEPAGKQPNGQRRGEGVEAVQGPAHRDDETEGRGGEGRQGLSCLGIGVALCCHHLCTYEDYVNPSFVAQAGLSPAEFRHVCRLSSWALSHRGPTADPFRQRLGMTCKAFLDAGRCVYLRERGYRADLVEYCKADVTPENRLLLATRPADT